MHQALIAVIDDEHAFTDMVCELLSDEGYITICANSSAEVHALVRDMQPDAILLDLRMERPDAGINVLTMLRIDPSTARIPVIVCSADTVFIRANEAHLQQHRCYILQKPFELGALLEAITTALKTRDETALLARQVHGRERLN